jgi:hypothetical protein
MTKKMLLAPVSNLHIKRPINSFMIWTKIKRNVIAKENPELSNSDISIYLGMLWNSLPNEEKYIYKLEAEKIKAEHLKSNPGYKYEPKSKKTNLQPTSQKRKYEPKSKADKQPTSKKSRHNSESETKENSLHSYQPKACKRSKSSSHNSYDPQNIHDPINDPEEFDYYDIFQNFITNKIY